MTRRKERPRLPSSAFADAFPVQPAPVAPASLVDAHPSIPDALLPAAVVLLPGASSSPVPVLASLVPFSLDAPDIPPSTALTTTYDATTPILPVAEGDSTDDAHLEIPVKNLRRALSLARVLDLDIKGGIITTDHDSLVNLLTKASKPDTIPIVLTNVLPPPLDAITSSVALINHPIYTTYRHRISSLSLFENVYVKLLPPAWVQSDEKELRNMIKLFIVPVLEAFGFERIIFGSGPPLSTSSPAPAHVWYNLVLESFRELAVSQVEMDKIFVENAQRVYG